jgi:hypothetical protein
MTQWRHKYLIILTTLFNETTKTGLLSLIIYVTLTKIFIWLSRKLLSLLIIYSWWTSVIILTIVSIFTLVHIMLRFTQIIILIKPTTFIKTSLIRTLITMRIIIICFNIIILKTLVDLIWAFILEFRNFILIILIMNFIVWVWKTFIYR